MSGLRCAPRWLNIFTNGAFSFLAQTACLNQKGSSTHRKPIKIKFLLHFDIVISTVEPAFLSVFLTLIGDIS